MGCLIKSDTEKKLQRDIERKKTHADHAYNKEYMRRKESQKKNNDISLIKSNFVTYGGFLRAAAENDVYTLRVFFDYECRYAWDQYPQDDDERKEKIYASHRVAIKDDRSKWNPEARRHLDQFQSKVKTPALETALHLACSFGHVEATKVLLKMGFDPSARDVNGFTVIHHAVCGGNYSIIEMLKEFTPEATFQTPAYDTKIGLCQTPFMLGVRLHRKKIVTFFIRNFAIDYQLRNSDNLTVYGISLISHHRLGMQTRMRSLTGEDIAHNEEEYLLMKRAERKSTTSSSSSSSSSKSKSKSSHPASRSLSSSMIEDLIEDAIEDAIVHAVN